MSESAAPGFCVNPWVAGGETVTLILQGVGIVRRRVSTRREVRALNGISVLPLGWDTAGRHRPLRTDPI